MIISVIIPNYNHAISAVKCIEALADQIVDQNHRLTITVVDDGSTDDSVSLIKDRHGNRIKLIELGKNLGRSTARNTGASESDSDFVLFIDSDCIATDRSFIQSYIDELSKGADLVFGQVSTGGDGFWDLMQKSTFKNRQHDFDSGKHWAYTTQNVCIKRDLFLEAGGFDLAFDKHGFEDRDLFIRLIGLGAMTAYCHAANVIHDDRISLASVSGKMFSAGRYASIPFRKKHLTQYMLSPYAKLDCMIHPWLKYLDAALWPAIKKLGTANGSWLENRNIPLSLRILFARIIYGWHYLHGTNIAHKEIGAQLR